MPGLALYDFGDMVRTTTSPAAEDEQDLSKVTMQFPMFEALVRGYLESAGEFLTPAEKKLLAFSGKLITFETGIRFLADYLAGDTYFKIHREGHNLDRCRTQFKLVESIERQEEEDEPAGGVDADEARFTAFVPTCRWAVSASAGAPRTPETGSAPRLRRCR